MALQMYDELESSKNKMNEQQRKDSSWSNQFWPWFIIFVLVSTIISGIVMIYIAVSHDDSLVVDNYYKEGLAINRVLTQKQNAVRLGVIANISMAVNQQEFIVDLPADITAQNKLIKVRFIHSTLSELDRIHFINRDNNSRYRLAMTELQQGRWNIIIEPVDGAWLLEQQVTMPVKSVVTITPHE